MPRVREAQWANIREFPNYDINDRGEIYNRKIERYMSTSINNYGRVKITLTDLEGRRFDRSVALMVAEAFVKPPNIFCDHVIVLDGDLSNVVADNLAWRPRGFARKYRMQLLREHPQHYHNLPVRNVTLDIPYDSVIDAGMTEGLIFDDVWRSTYSGSRCYPNGHAFEID